MSKRLIPALSIALPLFCAAPALAGPGSMPSFPLPPYLLAPQAQDRDEPAYALTGRDEVVRPRVQWIGGARDQRIVFERVARGEDRRGY